YPHIYIIALVFLALPIFLSRMFPQDASLLSTYGALILLPIFSAYCLIVIVPLVNHLRGIRRMPFDTKPKKMMIYALLRVAIFAAGLYLIVIYLLPAWRGAYEMYFFSATPDVVSIVVQDQGSALSFPPLVGAINTPGDAQTFLWFYGRVLPLGNTNSYTL